MIWVNYNDRKVTSLEWWLVRGNVPKSPSFELVNYFNLPSPRNHGELKLHQADGRKSVSCFIWNWYKLIVSTDLAQFQRGSIRSPVV